jgi:hypothetical protein
MITIELLDLHPYYSMKLGYDYVCFIEPEDVERCETIRSKASGRVETRRTKSRSQKDRLPSR